MKSPIIYQNKGFLIMEIMLAFSMLTLFTVSIFTLSSSMLSLKSWSIKELGIMEDLVKKFDVGLFTNQSLYGNDTKVFKNDVFSIAQSDYVESWGRNSCNPRINFNEDEIRYFPNGVHIGSSNPSTDLEVRNNIVYLTADSASASLHDFFIINAGDYANPRIISSLNTGPGLSAIEVAGPYVFLAQASTVNQLQIIDIHNRESPYLLSQLKLSLPTPTTTAPFATSIFYSKGFIYLGTTKWAGAEFSVIDVSNINSPVIVGTFETNTLVNDIYVRGDFAYLATSDKKQMRILDISNKSNPILRDYFSPTGWQTQEGRIVDYFEELIGLGRTVGGFNVLANHELFIFSTTSDHVSKDVPGGIYGIVMRQPYVFLLTRLLNKEFQVFKSDLSKKIFEMSLTSQPVKMACDGSNLFFVTGNSQGISILKLDY